MIENSKIENTIKKIGFARLKFNLGNYSYFLARCKIKSPSKINVKVIFLKNIKPSKLFIF
jgi:hypothetical protein